jgi:hypothetical protein
LSRRSTPKQPVARPRYATRRRAAIQDFYTEDCALKMLLIGRRRSWHRNDANAASDLSAILAND